MSFSSHRTGLYSFAFITQVVSLDQTFVHCPRFLTAASIRSLGRVSVPVWRSILSDPLKIISLVSFYLTNYLVLVQAHLLAFFW